MTDDRQPMAKHDLAILLVDDDHDIVTGMGRILRMDGYRVEHCASLEELFACPDLDEYFAILIDRKLPDGESLDRIAEVKDRAPHAAILIITGYPDLESSIRALKQGTDDYLLKPVQPDALRSSLSRIAQQRQAEQQARLLAAAVSHLGEGVLITEDELEWPGPRIVFVNEAICRITGYTAKELIGQTPRILQGAGTDQETRNYIRHELSAGRTCLVEVTNYRKDGSPYNAELFITPLLDATGRRTNFVSIHRDITERKRIEQALREGEGRLRAVLSTAADAIINIDRRGIITAVNPATERMFGYGQDGLIGQNVKILMPAPFHDEHDGYIARYLETGEARIIGIGREVTAKRRDGSTFPIDLAVSEVEHLGLFTGIIRNITERAEAQQKLLQSERLAALGEAMAGLAHESRNALQRSQACLDLLADQLAAKPESQELLETIQRAQDDLHRLYEEVRAFAAPIQLSPQYRHVGEILRKSWDDLSAMRKERDAHFLDDAVCDDLHCEVDPFAIGQVFRNILENAVQACGDSVEIKVVYTDANHSDMPALSIAIRDNGPGLAPEHAERVFHSFFTTKTAGTGLGMAIAQRIVQAHGGQIAVNPECPQGAEFVVTLPRRQP